MVKDDAAYIKLQQSPGDALAELKRKLHALVVSCTRKNTYNFRYIIS